MKLIHFQGLNCYHDCMITLANTFGLDYTEAFSRLWSEGLLRYDPICDVFLSRRLEETLESFGMKLEIPWVTLQERETGWAGLQAGNYAIIGTDACLIPWNPIYQQLHGPHYFIVQKGTAGFHDCYDPTYGISGQKLTAKELVFNSYALITVKMDTTAPFVKHVKEDARNLILDQSQEILKSHSETLEHFLEQAGVWMGKSKKEDLLPAKYVDALLTGRYLYRYFLKEQHYAEKRAPLFFSRQYYDQWLAAKNGFYKAALMGQKSAVFDEACCLLADLFEQELATAGQICSM